MNVNYEQFKKHKIPNLYIICNKCKLTIQDPNNTCKDETKCKMSSCKNKDRHAYKVRVKNAGGMVKERQKSLYGDFFDVAQEADKFTKLVKEGKADFFIPKLESISILDAVSFFLGKKDGYNVPEYQLKPISKHYRDELEKYLFRFLDSLKQKKIDPNLLGVKNISTTHIQIFVDYLRVQMNGEGFKPRYFNKHITSLREMLDVTCKAFTIELNIENLFNNARNPVGKAINKSLTFQEFDEIIKSIKVETGRYKKGRKKLVKNGTKETQNQSNHYRDWLINAYYLSLYTGRRREEILEMKWSDISNHKDRFFMSNENLKVSRAKKSRFDSTQLYLIPVFDQFMDFLISIGFNEKQGKDEYILTVENREFVKTQTMCDNLSKPFRHYSKLLGFDYTWYDLKNTYVSNLVLIAGDEANLITDTASMDTLKTHYLDNRVLYDKVMDRMKIN